jgi:predicted O-methyltransferase YrrM
MDQGRNLMNIERALKCNGWMEVNELEYLASAAAKSRRILEIGSWAGRSATAIASNTSGCLWCVDTWERALVHYNGAVLEPTLFSEFLQNTSGLPVIPVMTDSMTAAKWMKSAGMTFDMIFIDANHEGPAVREDILTWRELLVPGGILCGHDYEFSGWPDVKTVVDELIPKFKVINTIWTTED